MITVSIYKDKTGLIHGFRVKGHAEFSKNGGDIVCAAVSMLVINGVNSIESLTNEKTVVNIDETKGFIECSFPNRTKGSADVAAETLIQSLILGLQAVKEQYGNYIELSEEISK